MVKQGKKTAVLNDKEEVSSNLDATQIYLSEIGFSPLLSA